MAAPTRASSIWRRKLPDGSARLCPHNPEIVAQLHHAVAEEMAVSLQDFLLRRTAIGQSACLGLDCYEAIGGRMGALAGWSSRRLDAELEAYRGCRRAEPALPKRVIRAIVRPAWRGDAQTSRARNPTAIRLR